MAQKAMKINLLVAFLAIAAGLGACKQETAPPVDLKDEYYPLEIGNSLEYTVDSIIISPLLTNGRDTVHWQVREVVESTFTDNLGRTAHRIERYLRASDSAVWFISDVWYAVKETTTVERIEENLRFIRLIFPASDGRSWKGNAHIDSDSFPYYHDWDYEYVDVDEAKTVNGMFFDSTLTVSETADSTLIDMRYSEAIYAKNVGLVYKRLFDLAYVDTQPKPPLTPWYLAANRGYIVTMRIKDS